MYSVKMYTNNYIVSDVQCMLVSHPQTRHSHACKKNQDGGTLKLSTSGLDMYAIKWSMYAIKWSYNIHNCRLDLNMLLAISIQSNLS